MSACLFARVRVVAIIVAPTAFAIWNAAIPTLLDAAVTMTKSPVLSLACSIRAPHAVTYCIQDAAATSNEMFSGCSNGFDDTRGLEPEPTRKLSLLQISVCTEH